MRREVSEDYIAKTVLYLIPTPSKDRHERREGNKRVKYNITDVSSKGSPNIGKNDNHGSRGVSEE